MELLPLLGECGIIAPSEFTRPIDERRRDMPKSKPAARAAKKTIKRTRPATSAARARKTTAPRAVKTAPVKKPAALKEDFTDEYREYLERYEMSGEGRPKLGPAEFDRMDEEMWELIDIETAQGNLNDEQTVRYRELEFMLLLDNEV